MIQVVAKKFIQANQVEEYIETARELVTLTREEAGCLQYSLCQDTQTPNILSFVEQWESRAHLQAHMETEHFQRLVPLLATFNEKEGELNIYDMVI